MWFGLGMMLVGTAVTAIAVWLLTRLFPKMERPSPPNPTSDPLALWQARCERGEISPETLALIRRHLQSQTTHEQIKGNSR